MLTALHKIGFFFLFSFKCNTIDAILYGCCHNQHSEQLHNTAITHDNFIPAHPKGTQISQLNNFGSLQNLQKGCFGHVLK